MSQSSSASPDHPSRRRNAPLDEAFDRLVQQDSLLGLLASRHWLQHDLRLTLLTVLGAPLVWLLTGQPLLAGILTAGFAGLVVLGLWTSVSQGPADAKRLLAAIRWVAVAMTAVALLVTCNAAPTDTGTGSSPAAPAIGTPKPVRPAPGQSISTP